MTQAHLYVSTHGHQVVSVVSEDLIMSPIITTGTGPVLKTDHAEVTLHRSDWKVLTLWHVRHTDANGNPTYVVADVVRRKD